MFWIYKESLPLFFIFFTSFLVIDNFIMLFEIQDHFIHLWKSPIDISIGFMKSIFITYIFHKGNFDLSFSFLFLTLMGKTHTNWSTGRCLYLKYKV